MSCSHKNRDRSRGILIILLSFNLFCESLSLFWLVDSSVYHSLGLIREIDLVLCFYLASRVLAKKSTSFLAQLICLYVHAYA